MAKKKTPAGPNESQAFFIRLHPHLSAGEVAEKTGLAAEQVEAFRAAQKPPTAGEQMERPAEGVVAMTQEAASWTPKDPVPSPRVAEALHRIR